MGKLHLLPLFYALNDTHLFYFLNKHSPPLCVGEVTLPPLKYVLMTFPLNRGSECNLRGGLRSLQNKNDACVS